MPPPKRWYHTYPTLTPGHEPSPYSPLLRIASFGWLLRVVFSNWWPIYATVYFIFIIFVLLYSTWDSVSPRTLPPALHFTRLPSTANVDNWLVVVSSFLSFGLLRSMPSPSLYFLMGYVLALEMKEPTAAPPKTPVRALYGLDGRCCAESWGRGDCCHGDRGQSRWGVGW